MAVRTFVKFTFIKVDPARRRRPPAGRARDKREFAAACHESGDVRSHLEVGRRYTTIDINTAYPYGLDDQEFVVSFDADEPGDLLDLVHEPRGTESSSFTLGETPIFTCSSPSVEREKPAADAPVPREAAAPAPPEEIDPSR